MTLAAQTPSGFCQSPSESEGHHSVLLTWPPAAPQHVIRLQLQPPPESHLTTVAGEQKTLESISVTIHRMLTILLDQTNVG